MSDSNASPEVPGRLDPRAARQAIRDYFAAVSDEQLFADLQEAGARPLIDFFRLGDSKPVAESEERFNYCVGRPWHADNPNGSVSIYMHGAQVFYGTLEEAKGFQGYVNDRTKKENHIYRLVKVEDS